MTENTQKITERLEYALHDENGITPEIRTAIEDAVTGTDILGECLPELKKFLEYASNKAAEADIMAKEINESKKMWKEKAEQLLEVISHLLTEKFGISSLETEDVKAKITKRSVLEVDDEFLTGLYVSKDLRTALTMLPPYIKVSMTIDKRLLSAHLKENPALLNTYPEHIHTKENSTVTLK